MPGVRPLPRQTEHRAASGIRSLWPEVFGIKTVKKTPYLQNTIFISRELFVQQGELIY